MKYVRGSRPRYGVNLILRLVLGAWSIVLGLRASAQPAPTTRPAVNLIAMGDWGNGAKSQKEVAGVMSKYIASVGGSFDGAVLAGDNFYGKLSSTQDKRWKRDFEDMYAPAAGFAFPFYAVAGNHDLEAKKLSIEMGYARENPQSRWKFPARWYRVDLPAGSADPMVTVLMLDSNKDKLKADWAGELKWLEYQLEKTPKLRKDGSRHWVIAVAHHPLFSNGQHGDNGVLQTTWGARFKKLGLDMFVGGHDHDLQHLELDGWPMSFVQVGGGGASTREMRRDNRGPFSMRTNGFAHLAFAADKVTVQFVAKDGAILHAFDRTGEGKITVLKEGKRDAAAKDQLKALNGQGQPKSDEDD